MGMMVEGPETSPEKRTLALDGWPWPCQNTSSTEVGRSGAVASAIGVVVVDDLEGGDANISWRWFVLIEWGCPQILAVNMQRYQIPRTSKLGRRIVQPHTLSIVGKSTLIMEYKKIQEDTRRKGWSFGGRKG